MSFFKYYKEKQDADGENLWWPGGPDGFPFRGTQPPQTTQEEYEEMKPSLKFRCRTFYLDNENDLKDYTNIRDKCSNGYYLPIDRERIWDEDKKNYRIYLEWAEPAYEIPSNVTKDAVKDYTENKHVQAATYNKLAGLQSNSKNIF